MSVADFSHLHFLRPWWLLALIALPLVWRTLRASAGEANAWRDAVDAHLLAYLLVPGDTGAAPTRVPQWLALAAWTLATFALAGPAWERLPQPLYQNKAARVIALELSQSMLAQDVKPSRYARARFKIADILKRSSDMQTALIAYAGDAFVVAPLTDDVNTVANLVDSLDPTVMPALGNAAGRAIDLGVKLLQQGGVRTGEIVLLADGVDAGAGAAAARARSAGVRVSVLGIGSADGAPVALAQGGFLKDANGNIALARLDAAALGALASAGGGRYATFSGDAADLDAMLAPLAARDAVATHAGVQSERFLDRGPWLMLALLPLVAFGFRRGWLLLLPLAMLAQTRPAQANVWDDLWRRPDQQAQAQLDAGRAKEAQALARDADLRGSAAYRAEDFAAAAKDFESAAADNAAANRAADAHYNRGNALAKQGKYEDAIAAYDKALASAPQMEDAAANRKAVQEWLKQQQQRKDQQQQQQDHQGNPQQQPGNDQPQDSQGGKAGKSDQPGQSDGDKQQSRQQDGKDQQGGSPQDGEQRKQQNPSGQPASGAEPDSAARARQPKAGSEPDDKSQRQFEQGIDQALQQARAGKNAKDGKPVRLGAREADQRSEKDQAVEQWLQRVPDDPGGLLRRKFQLEYQRRQHGNQETGQ